MKQKQLTLLLIGLISLVIFSSMVALIFYMKHQDMQGDIEKMTTAFVAKTAIPKGEKVTMDTIVVRSLPISYAGSEPLGMAKIVGNYAAVDITAGDLITAQKLSRMPVEAPADTADERNASLSPVISKSGEDTLSVPMSLFKNPDMSLRIGDTIDIVGVSGENPEQNRFTTRYIALGVTVGGFIRNGVKTDTISSFVEDEKTHLQTAAPADAILLHLSPRQINRMLSVYYGSQGLNNNRAYNPDSLYKGHIWMVKSGSGAASAKEKSEWIESPSAHKTSATAQTRARSTLPKRSPGIQNATVHYEQ